MSEFMSEEYAYAVARVRAKELTLLSQSDMESLISAGNYEECRRVLSDLGWESDAGDTAEEILKREHDKTWKFAAELERDPKAFQVFLYANDYHNLKFAIKEAATNREHPHVYIDRSQCVYDPQLLKRAVAEHDYAALPDSGMREAAKEAHETLLHTGDGQMCDIIIDRAALMKIYQAGKDSKDETLALYSELFVALANIKTAIRGCQTGKDQSFLLQAMAPCDTINVQRLSKASTDGMEAIYSYLEHTAYSGATPEIQKGNSAFERWCDDLIINKMKPQLHNQFTIGPVIAYIVAKENEIKTVRIILSGKINQLSDEAIRERVRETYV